MNKINPTNATLVSNIFDRIGNRPLSHFSEHTEVFNSAEEAGLIDFGSFSSAERDHWRWDVSPQELIILAGATDVAVAEAHRLLTLTAVAVREHGHGQGACGRIDTDKPQHECPRMPRVISDINGPKIELVSRKSA